MTARIVYLMGPSGAGKDSVLALARTRIDGRAPVVFAHRYATRAPDPGHPNEIALGAGEFALRLGRDLLAFHWTAWNVRYGVGMEIRSWAARGLTVVVSGSREHFAAMACREAGLLPVLVTASAAARAHRLRARAREDETAIAARLRRGEALTPRHPALVTIENDGPLEQAADSLTGLLLGEADRAAPGRAP